MKLPPLAPAGLVLGLGLGGFIDGIIFHQILGWHHLVCTTETCQPRSIAELQQQNIQDGYFHLATLILTMLGVWLLFQAGRRSEAPWSGKVLGGAIVAGWGVFNLVEGLINHQILGIHHVLPGGPYEFFYDLLFLASGALLIGFGFRMVRNGQTETSSA